MKYIAIFLRKIGEYEKREKPIEKDKVIPVTVETGKPKKEKKVKTISTKIKGILKRNRPNYVKIGEKEFSESDETISYRGNNSFMVQLEAFSFQDKEKLYYYYDFDEGDLIGLETLLRFGMKPKDLNHFTDGKTIGQLVNSAKSPDNSSKLIYVAVLLPVICLIVGILIGHYLMPNITVQPVPNTTIPSV